MRALVDTVDTQRIVMPEQRSLTNVNTTADLTVAAIRHRFPANSLNGTHLICQKATLFLR